MAHYPRSDPTRCRAHPPGDSGATPSGWQETGWQETGSPESGSPESGKRKPVNEFLLPATDAGVLAQIGGLVAVTAVVLWLLRRQREVQILVIGIAVVLLAVMGLRTLH